MLLVIKRTAGDKTMMGVMEPLHEGGALPDPGTPIPAGMTISHELGSWESETLPLKYV